MKGRGRDSRREEAMSEAPEAEGSVAFYLKTGCNMKQLMRVKDVGKLQLTLRETSEGNI